MPKRHQQLEFQAAGFEKPKDWFGGKYLKNSHAKTRRPLSSKFPIHLVLRSKKAKGAWSFLHAKQFRKVNGLVREVAKRHGVRIYDYANSGNHLHILLRLRSIHGWSAFIRELSGRLAQVVQGLSAKDKTVDSFWDQRPFTRIVSGWNKAYRVVKDYVLRNRMEAEGLLPRKQSLEWSSA